ncbi:MAG: CheC, inhibitor of methylation / FliN fusion protein [Thermoleophilia bacterium]|nr:CheC, inhibitor of methylation / FliN fusion protein [Thermoleophilia bacterium]
MTADTSKASQLLAAALHGAADVARARLERDVTVVEAPLPASNAILRFDLTFSKGGRLSWFVTNEDATGFSDILIGGQGDRGAVLTEMHLDALTVAFSDMLQRSVETIAAGLDEHVEAGEIDLGMEQELPAADPAGARVALALEIAGFGTFPIVQQADPDLAHYLDQHALASVAAPAAPAVAAPPAAVAHAEEAPPTPASPVVGLANLHAAPNGDNVVPIEAPVAATSAQAIAQRGGGDLDMLMNVPLPLTVELGRTQRTIRELVEFSVGSIIELGKLAGDPLDIMVNDRVIARGEVVVIDEEFGIRVTEIVSPDDRIVGLGG